MRWALVLLVSWGLLGARSATATSLSEALQRQPAATEEGALSAVALLREALMRPPGRVDAHARGLCLRYLPTAEARLASAGPAQRRAHAEALEALALCRWLAGDDDGARRAALALLDGPRPDLARAIAFAERTLWPGSVQARVAERAGEDARWAEASERLARVASWRDALEMALHGREPSGGLLVTSVAPGGDAARAGVRPGDLLLSVQAARVQHPDDLRRELARRPASSVLVLRAGQRIEAHWAVGAGPVGNLEALPVPERLAP